MEMHTGEGTAVDGLRSWAEAITTAQDRDFLEANSMP